MAAKIPFAMEDCSYRFWGSEPVGGGGGGRIIPSPTPWQQPRESDVQYYTYSADEKADT